MKRLILLFIIAAVFWSDSVFSAQGEPYTPEKANPQKDPVIEKEYKRHQETIKRQREWEKQHKSVPKYEVHPSGPTPQGGNPPVTK